MKKNIYVLAALIGFVMISYSTSAQDWHKVNPKLTKVLADTTFLQAFEVTLAPGEKSDVHTHPANFFYALTDGTLKVHYSDGKEETRKVKAGESGVSGPERPHYAENVGKTQIRFLLVELKEHPYKK